MKVLIKNVQLEYMYPNIKSLETCGESDLRRIATAYQIGTQKREKAKQEFNVEGERVEQSTYRYVPRTRMELVSEIRERLKVVIDIPREFWSNEQFEAFAAAGISETKDANVEMEFKARMGVYKDLMPYEDLPRHKQDTMFLEVDIPVWEFLSNKLNYYTEKQKEGLFSKRFRPLVYPQKMIPENDEEKEMAKEMNTILKAKKNGMSSAMDKAFRVLGGQIKEDAEE